MSGGAWELRGPGDAQASGEGSGVGLVAGDLTASKLQAVPGLVPTAEARSTMPGSGPASSVDEREDM